MKHHVENSVIFLGHVPEQEIPSLMSIANILIYPYERRTLAMSGAVCQAISALKPIVCTDIPALTSWKIGKPASR